MKNFFLVLILFGSTITAQADIKSCRQLFPTKLTQVFHIQAAYVGENTGAYIDPIYEKPWNVVYFSKHEREQYKLQPYKKLFFDAKNEPISTEFDPESMHNEQGLVVLTRNYELFFMPFEQRGKFHHSSLAAGKEVLFAGTMSFHKGVIRDLTADSGHYKPNAKALTEFIEYLEYLDVDLSQLKISGVVAHKATGQYSMSLKEWKNRPKLIY